MSSQNLRRFQASGVEHKECTELASLLLEFEELIAETLGTIIGHKAVVQLKEGTVPKLYFACPIPFPMKKAVEGELKSISKARYVGDS